MSGVAGFKAKVFRSGNAIRFTNQGVRKVNNVYQLTTSSRQVLDPNQLLTISESGSAVFSVQNGRKSPGNTIDYDIDYLFGVFTRDPTASGDPAAGDVTVDGAYHPLHSIGAVRSYNWNFSVNLADSTTLDSDEFMNTLPTRFNGQISFDRLFLNEDIGAPNSNLRNSAKDWNDYIADRTSVLFEGRPVGLQGNYDIRSGSYDIQRAWCRVESANTQGSDNDLTIQNVNLQLDGKGGVTRWRWLVV